MDRHFFTTLDWAYPHMGEIRQYRVIDLDDYDLVPKRSFLEREVKILQQSVEQLKETREQYDKRIAEIEEQIKQKQKALK